MLFALVQPLSAVGLGLAYLVGLTMRATGQQVLARGLTGSTRPGPLRPVAGRDFDGYGAAALLLGGTGWGRAAPVPRLMFATWPAMLRRAVIYLAGPVLPLAAGEAVLAGYRASFPGSLGPALYRPSDVLAGLPGPGGEQVMLSLGVGLICFGLVAVLPLPPCDGWGMLWLLWRHPGERASRVRYWLADRNVGRVVLLLLLIPLGARGAAAHFVLDAMGDPLVRAW